MNAKLGAATVGARLEASRAWLCVCVAAGGVGAFGLTRRAVDASGVDRTLLGFTLPLVAPLVCYALFELVHRGASTTTVLEPLARHGADRRVLALGALLALSGACAGACALLASVAALSAMQPSTELVRELDACAWGGALTGAAYAGLFALGSRGGSRGRLWLLAADLVFGSGSGILAFPWPRGHARSLLGGAAVLDAPASLAAVVLTLFWASCLLHCASRGPS